LWFSMMALLELVKLCSYDLGSTTVAFFQVL
jgi:hypothetical protein